MRLRFVRRLELVLSNNKMETLQSAATVRWQVHVAESQIITTPSRDDDASSVESCEKATDVTVVPWP